MIEFVVYGEPVAQGRPRATTVNGKVRTYDPNNSREYKHYIRLAAVDHAPEKLLEGPVELELRIYRPTPKSYSKRKKELAEKGEIRPTGRPDVDNYVKSVKDALRSVIWKDDNQVVRILAEKFYSQKPRTEIIIRELGRG